MSMKSIYESQDKKCAMCKRPFDFREMQMVYIKPLSSGGMNTEDNMQVLCKKCASRWQRIP